MNKILSIRNIYNLALCALIFIGCKKNNHSVVSPIVPPKNYTSGLEGMHKWNGTFFKIDYYDPKMYQLDTVTTSFPLIVINDSTISIGMNDISYITIQNYLILHCIAFDKPASTLTFFNNLSDHNGYNDSVFVFYNFSNSTIIYKERMDDTVNGNALKIYLKTP